MLQNKKRELDPSFTQFTDIHTDEITMSKVSLHILIIVTDI